MIVVDSRPRRDLRAESDRRGSRNETSRRFDSRQRIRIYRYSIDAIAGTREAEYRSGERADDANNWKDRYRTLGVLGYEEFIVPTFFVTARGTLNKFYNGLLVLISYVLPVSRIAAYVFSKP